MDLKVLYNGQVLKYVRFGDKPCLWITSPSQISMDKMKFVGGYPNEYCIFWDDLSNEEKEAVHINVDDLLQYRMTDAEQIKAKSADVILSSFNKSYQPRLWNVCYTENLSKGGYFETKYIHGLGYILLIIDEGGKVYQSNYMPCINIEKYLPDAVNVLAFKNVQFSDFVNNSAIKSLKKQYFNNLEYSIYLRPENEKTFYSCLYARFFEKQQEYAKYIGFKYYESGIWMLDL